MSSRRLAVLLRHLPGDSALAHSLHGESAEWSVTDHLLAAAVDHLAVGNWMFSAVHREDGAAMPEAPEPIGRPGHGDTSSETEIQASAKADEPSASELAWFFG